MIKNFICPALVSVLTFLICDILLKRWLIEPWARYQVLKERAAYCLSFYEPYYTKPIRVTNENENSDVVKRYYEARESLRDCAAQLRGFSEVLKYPGKRVSMPTKSEIRKASEQLFQLSSTMWDSLWESMETKYGEKTNAESLKIAETTRLLLKIHGKKQPKEE